MEQQEIDKLVAQCKQITNEFREKLEPAVDEHGRVRMVDEIILLATTAEEVHRYIGQIQNILNEEALKSIEKYASVIDCRNLYITNKLQLSGNLPFCDFSKTNFSDSVYFRSVVFSDLAIFHSVTFSDYVDFSNSTFSNFSVFHNAKFFGSVYFYNVTFSDYALFGSIQFRKATNFNDAKFKNTTDFKNTAFTIPPQFHKAELHPDTSFGQPEDIARNFGRCKTQQDYMAYRALKQHMSNVHAKLEESIFFALEQKTKRNIDSKDFLKNWSNYLISLFYDRISGYGQNTAKPIVILIVTGLIIFPAIYWALDDILGRSIIVNAVEELKKQNIWGWYQSLPVHLGYSLQSIFNPLVFFNKDSAFIATNPLIRCVASIQSMFTIAVFALWLLAVRNRFQKGS